MNLSEGGNAKLSSNDRNLIYKIAFDSIPNMRRNVIKIVAEFSLGATDQGIADKMSMQLDAVKIWLEELIAIKVLERLFDPVMRKYKYRIRDNFLSVVQRYEHVETKNEALISEDEDSVGSEGDYGLGGF